MLLVPVGSFLRVIEAVRTKLTPLHARRLILPR